MNPKIDKKKPLLKEKNLYSFTIHLRALLTLRKTSVENVVGEGENAGN